MQETTGRASSSSPPSSWPDEHAHTGHHYSLLVFPDGRVILTTPDELEAEDFDFVRAIFQDWVSTPGSDPLIIGSCKVILQPIAPVSGDVVRGIR